MEINPKPPAREKCQKKKKKMQNCFAKNQCSAINDDHSCKNMIPVQPPMCFPPAWKGTEV